MAQPLTPSDAPAWQRSVPLLVWVMAVLVGLFIPLKILQLGYVPADDAMCHVAKALSGKPWPQILLMDERFAQDEHPGWHALLGALHRGGGLDADQLIMVSVAAPFVLFWLALLLGRKRPEAMLLAVFLASLTAPGSFGRFLFGRPFIAMLVVYVLLLQLWARGGKVSPGRMLLSVLLMGFSVWVHGSWYLFGFVAAGLAFGGAWRKAWMFGGCWLAGSLLGALLTGHPLGYLHETTVHLLSTFGGSPQEKFLVTELRPDPGDLFFAGVIVLVLLWRMARGDWRGPATWTPLLALAVLGWFLGLKVSRFWVDWGFPAAILWLAGELEEVLARPPWRPYPALVLACFAAAGPYFIVTHDLNERWTQNATIEPVTPKTPGIDGWLPEPGGLVYSSDMRVFFRMFFQNPHADWRYVLGFEPGIMTPDNFEILRKIQWNSYTSKAYEPWVKKMRPGDRMILLQDASLPPGIAGLEWYYAATETWIGRLPRKP
jgi:hypothetical protein